MSLLQDIFAKLYGLFFALEKPASTAGHGVRNLYRKGYTYLGISAFWWYLGIVLVSFSPLLGIIYKIFRARKSPTKRTSRHKDSHVRATRPDLISAVNRNRITGTYAANHALQCQQDNLCCGDDLRAKLDNSHQDQLICSPEAGDGPCTKAGSNLRSRMIKLLIKKPVSLEGAFLDGKKKFVFSLVSPAKMIKRKRRTGGCKRDAIVPVKEISSTPEQIYNTAKSIVNKVDILPSNARMRHSFEPSYINSNPDTVEQYNTKEEACRGQINSRKDFQKSGNNKVKIPKSPAKKKKRKKKQCKRSIFSKSQKIKNERVPDNPLSEADNKILGFGSKEIQHRMGPSKKQQITGNDKCKGCVAASKRYPGNKGTNSFPDPLHTESATQELQKLIRQVESENRVRKSVSPRMSQTFAEIQISNQRLCSDKCRKKTSGALRPDISMNVHPNLPIHRVEPKRFVSTVGLSTSRAKSQQSVTGVDKSAQMARSGGQCSRSDNSCCTRGVSISILSKIASMSSQDKSSAVSGTHQGVKRVGLSKRGFNSTSQCFSDDIHRAFVMAPRCYNLKPVSPDVSSQPKPMQFADRRNVKSKAQCIKSTVNPNDHIQSLSKQTFLQKNARNKRTSDLLKKVETQIIRNLDHPGRVLHNKPIAPSAKESSVPPHPCRRFVTAKRQNSASPSPSSHYSFLGCIGPSESATKRNALVQRLSIQKNLETVRDTVRKNSTRPQPIEGYILNSRTPIANTLLLCRSGITTTYENWATEKARGPGKVKAISKTSCTNRFPSLSSYLDHLERKAKFQTDSLKNEGDNSERQALVEVDLTKQKNTGIDNGNIDESGHSKYIFDLKNNIVDEQCAKSRQDLCNLDGFDQNQSENKAKIETSAANAVVNEIKLENKNSTPSTIKNTHSVPSAKIIPNDKHVQTKDSKTVKQFLPSKKDDKTSRLFRPKLRFKYLPLSKQPLPFSSPAKNKAKNSKMSECMQQVPKAETTLPIAEIKSKSIENKTLKNGKQTTSAKPESKIVSGTKRELKTVFQKSKDGTKEADNEQLLYVEKAKPVVVNLRKFCKKSFSNSQALSKQSQGIVEKFPIPKTPSIASEEEASSSVDLQSLLEMAKSVLKKSKPYITTTKNEKVPHATRPLSKIDHIKIDDQASESSPCKWSGVSVKATEEVKPGTAGDQSYTHLYKSKESRGLRPWRTTKAFTTRLKLMLQNSTENCMRRENKKLFESKRGNKSRKAYVVHKANVPKFHFCLKSSHEPRMSDSAAEVRNSKVIKTKEVKEKDHVKVVSSKISTKKGKAPVLRTEVLAKRRRKNVDKRQLENLNSLTKKKREKPKGAPLHLTNTLMYKESEEKALECELIKVGSPANENLLRRLPLIGKDPAQVARQNEKALHMAQSSTCSPAQSRENQVQSELGILLEKMKTRSSADLGIAFTRGGGESHTKEKLVEENPPFRAAEMGDNKSLGDACITSAFHEHIAVSDKFGNYKLWKDEHVAYNTMSKQELGHEPPTAHLKFLLQCACNRFNSLPNLPDSSNGSSDKSEIINQGQESCVRKTKPIKVHSVICAKEYDPLGVYENSGQDSVVYPIPCKLDNKSKSENALSEQIFGEIIEENLLGKTATSKSTINPKNEEKRTLRNQSSLITLIKNHENKYKSSRAPFSKQGVGQKKFISSNIDTPMKTTTEDYLVHEDNPSFEIIRQRKKTRIDNIRAPMVSSSSENNCVLKRDPSSPTDCNKMSPLSLGFNCTKEIIKRPKSINFKHVEEKPSVNLPSFEDRHGVGGWETYKTLSTNKCVIMPDYLKGSSIAIFNQLPADFRDHTGVAYSGSDYSRQPYRYNIDLEKLVHDNCLSCPSLVDCRPLKIQEFPENDEAIISSKLFDDERSFSAKYTDASQATTLNSEATVISEHRTVETPVSPKFSPKPNRTAWDFVYSPNTDDMKSQKGFNGGCKLLNALDNGREEHSNIKANSLNAQDIIVRKALSYISEESDNSDVNLNVQSGETRLKRQSSNHKKIEKFVDEDVNTVQNKEVVIPLPQTQLDFLQETEHCKKNALVEQTFQERKTHLHKGRQSSYDAENSVLEMEDLDPDFKPLTCTMLHREIFSEAHTPIPAHSSIGPRAAGCQYPQDKTNASVTSSNMAVNSVTQARYDVGVTSGKNRIQDIPVTVIYTNQNSDIPDISFTIEDEFSFDSWAQNSVCICNKSLESGPNSNAIYQSEKVHSDHNNNDFYNEAESEDCLQKFLSSPAKHSKVSPEFDLKHIHNELVNTDKKMRIVENDKSNSNEFSNDKKDLESLLDSALDKTFASKRTEGTSLIFSNLRTRKAKGRRAGIRRIGLSREILRGTNANSPIFGKKMLTAKPTHTPSNLKTRLVTLKGNVEQRLSCVNIICSSKVKDVKKVCPLRKVGFETPPMKESNEEQTLQDMLNQIPAQPFGITRNRKSRENDLTVPDQAPGTYEMHVSSSLDAEGKSKFLDRCDVFGTPDPHDLPSPLKPIQTCDTQKDRSGDGIKRIFQDKMEHTCLGHTVPHFEGHSAVKVGDQKNADIKTDYDALHQECTRSVLRKSPHYMDEMEDCGNDQTLKEKPHLKKAESFSTQKTMTTTKTLGDAANNGLPTVSLAANISDVSTQRLKTQMNDQEKCCKKETSYNGSPCSSKSSSIVLSWVGSHQSSDVEANFTSQHGGDHHDSMASLGCSAADAGVSLCDDRDSRLKVLSDILTTQRSFSRFDHAFSNSEFVSNAGPLKQSNLNENNTKSEMEICSFNSEVIEDSSMAISYDDNGSYDECVELDSLSNSQKDCYNEKNNSLFRRSNKKYKDTIIDQESYFQNLMHNMTWDEQTPMPKSDCDLVRVKPQNNFEPQVEKFARQEFSTGQSASGQDSRCDYVISAWTNQRQHSDLGLGVSLSTAPNQKPGSGAACTSLPSSKAQVTENKNSKTRGTHCSGSLDAPVSKLRRNRSNDSGCRRKLNKSQELCSTKISNGVMKISKMSFASNSTDTGVSGSQSKFWKSNGDGEKSNFALTLEEHLRLCSGTSRTQASQTATNPDLCQPGGRGLLSLHDHLTTRSDRMRSREGSRLQERQYNLNWYRPNSPSPSNSMNASHTNDPLRPFAESRLREPNNIRAHNDTLRPRDRLETGDNLVSNRQTATAVNVASRLERHQVLDTALRGQRRDSNPRVSTIVQMFERKNSTTEQVGTS